METHRPDRNKRKQLTLTEEEEALLDRAAAVADLTFTQWARAVLLPAARQQLEYLDDGGGR